VDLNCLMSACYDLARQASVVVRSVFSSGDLKVVEKAENSSQPSTDEKKVVDPQTIADIMSQKLIVGSLKNTFKDLTIIGEEGNLKVEDKDVVKPRLDLLKDVVFPSHLCHLSSKDLAIWVDPLDGTQEYTKGVIEAVTILIGISFQGKALGGVINVPFTESQRTLWGVVDVGVFDSTVGKIPVRKPKENVTSSPPRGWVVTSRSHSTTLMMDLINKFSPQKILSVGGAGNKGLMVLDGKVEAYLFPQNGTKRWDTCAVEAILHTVGGKVSDSFGEPIVYDPLSSSFHNDNGCLVTFNIDHQTYVLDKSVKLSKF